MTGNRRPLYKAVAHYLFVESKDLPDGESGLLRAAALVLLKEPIPLSLLKQAAKTDYNDEPLYSGDIRIGPDLDEVWKSEA
jgi:hypothetical protein